MTYIILILVSLLLFVGFIALTFFEKRRGLRVAGHLRNRLDRKAGRVGFIASHVDWGAFARHVSVSVVQRIAHDIAHTVLLVVRTLERLLTRFVKYLRERRGAPALPDTDDSTRFSRALGHLRDAVRAGRSAKAEKQKSNG